MTQIAVISIGASFVLVFPANTAESSSVDALLSQPASQPPSPSFEILDWLVLAIYAVLMMAIGVYYERRNKNADDYLLGGRAMKSWTVGISLFATLMSTLTYLAVPGEMIQHGPMILSRILAFPLIYLVVARFIIPFIMKLRITSAYEILEQRLGLSVRMLGSTLFLVLRLLWMALIVYATSSTVLVPLMHLDPSATPWVCVGMAVLTVAYTSMGGLQAVVFTDVLQTFIMLGGALLSIILITVNLGGVSAWWPTGWSSQWDAPSFFFATEARVTMSMAILANFVWYVCTAGSDQMAIQRYLATRDAQAARRMFGISLVCDVGVTLLLAALGLAVFAYFNAHPEMLPEGGTLASNADQLLPRFIVQVLPAGISGLVVAGILSAAMDSLSSGVNSSCSVITVDWLDRFRRVKLHGQQHVYEAKIVSWLVGLVVVVLSLFASYIEGNLQEKCYTVVNLLTAPLFVLFFMAMFVPWATALGTWLAAAASIAIAVAMAYGNFLGLSFLWILPVSLATGIVVGTLASLLPMGSRRPMIG
jgi:solute:Na+ symporter, SSS family